MNETEDNVVLKNYVSESKKEQKKILYIDNSNNNNKIQKTRKYINFYNIKHVEFSCGCC